MKTVGHLFKTLFLTTLYLACVIPGAMSQQTAGQRFEKALYLEEVNGKLQQAIEQYQDDYFEGAVRETKSGGGWVFSSVFARLICKTGRYSLSL